MSGAPASAGLEIRSKRRQHGQRHSAAGWDAHGEPMTIELTNDHYIWKAGERLDAVKVVPHGGYSDDSHQYVVMVDGREVCIRSGHAREVH